MLSNEMSAAEQLTYAPPIVPAATSVPAGVQAGSVNEFKAPIPVSDTLKELFPQGGLRRGSVVTVVGSATIALTVVAEATQQGLWCAAVGTPELGAVAAAGLGVELERFPLIPNPGPDWATVVGALVDGFDLILLQTNNALPAPLTRKLEARMRPRGTVLVLLSPMPNAWHHTDFVMREADVTYSGLGYGHGAITGRNFSVVLEGRGAAARPRRTEMAV